MKDQDGNVPPETAGEATGSANEAKARGARGAAVAAGAGFEFAAAIALGLFAGHWLDKRFGTTPWLIILGVFTGAAAGFYNIIRTLTTANQRAKSQREKRP